MGRLDGRVAFVTGAARGQGRSHAVRLAEDGADIIAVDLCRQVDSVRPFYRMPTTADLAETARLVEDLDRRVVARQADVREYDQLESALGAGLAELGGLDIVCANAGIFTYGVAWEIDEQTWRDVIDINLTGVWHTVKAAVPPMIQRGRSGAIVITSSTAGLKGLTNIAHYVASKHAVVGLMRTLANELAPYRIRVNTVHPTTVDTDMIQNEATYRLFLPDHPDPTREEAAEAFQTTNALPVPWVEPRDISNAIAWLVSDEARYVTGVALPVDAGSTVI
ncbi:MAG: mycofactocin-coupled SDR family oxidoreductase [Streptosporangiales bacterium]|nr:mycofactocin-coupled SDR family oxidoreductase [Streptosporangiales bacterium]